MPLRREPGGPRYAGACSSLQQPVPPSSEGVAGTTSLGAGSASSIGAGCRLSLAAIHRNSPTVYSYRLT